MMSYQWLHGKPTSVEQDFEMNPDRIDEFCEEHRLPDSFRQVVSEHYAPLARWVAGQGRHPPQLIGVSGAQGTGKSTLAEYLGKELAASFGWSVAAMSMDDFYLSRARRCELGRDIHPLLTTRGPPGTHDPDLLCDYLQRLRNLGPDESMTLPRFDKATDDTAPLDSWPVVAGPVDAIILEGWCLGVPPQSPDELVVPINDLEATEDSDARWRQYINACLQGDYARLFSKLDRLVFLQVPDLAAVLRWRTKQEEKLASRLSGDSPGGDQRVEEMIPPGIMNESGIRTFVQHFERLTRVAIDRLPARADVTLVLDSNHGVSESRYRR